MPRLDVYQRNQSIPATAVSAPLRSENPIPATVQRIADQYRDIIAQQRESIRKRDNANQLLNLQTAISDDFRAFEEEEKGKTGPDTYDNLDRTQAITDKITENRLKGITDPDQILDVKKYIAHRSEIVKTSLTNHHITQRNEVTKQAINSASESRLKDAYAGIPFDMIREELFQDAVKLVKAGTLDNTKAEDFIVEQEKKIAERYLDGLLYRENYSEVTRLMNDGEFSRLLDDKARMRFDKELKPRLQANKVDEVVEQIKYMYPENQDEPFEISKMMKKVDSLTDDAEVRKDVRARLISDDADREKESKRIFDYNYGIIADAWERNPKLSTADVMKMPEFSKLTTAQQGNALAKIRGKIEHRDTTERTTRSAELSAVSAARSAAAAERANVERKYDSAYYYWRSRPEELSTMNDAQFSGLRLEMGDKQFAHLQDDRKKLNSPEALADASNHANAITSVLDTIPGVNDSDKARYFTKLKRAIASEQKRVGKQLSNPEIENVVIENMQIHLVKEKGIFGRQKEKRKIEVLKTDQPAIPEAYQKRIDAVATKRGRVFSVPEQQKLYRAMLANETK